MMAVDKGLVSICTALADRFTDLQISGSMGTAYDIAKSMHNRELIGLLQGNIAFQ
jgi:hypothetical protein